MTCLIGKDLFGYGAGLAALAAGLLAGASAQAAVVISSAATSGINCSSGVCVPTAKNAVLNTGDLENLLASGNVEVTTTGSDVQAQDIIVKSALSWSGTGALSLDAYRSITVNQAVAVEGQSGLTLTTNDGGKNGVLSFGSKGHVGFTNLASSLTINGAGYTFESSVDDLASAIAANPKGNYALPANYSAKAENYTAAPIATTFNGTFEGLGNAISHLTIKDNFESTTPIGLFQELGKTGAIRDIGLAHVSVTVRKTPHGRPYKPAGALVGDSYGTVFGSWASGTVKTGRNSLGDAIGGLVGYNEKTGVVSHSHTSTSVLNGTFGLGGLVALNDGMIEWSYSTGTVSGDDGGGGLVGLNGYNALGQIEQSFATGAVAGYNAGGLVGQNDGSITDSFATGSATGSENAFAVGGLAATNTALSTIARCYSTGTVSGGGTSTYLGGLVGYDLSASGSISYAYWDTQTSGITNPDQGAGNVENDPGITGLTTDQFRSGLPDGFDPLVWNEKSSINDGFPYLIEDPPP